MWEELELPGAGYTPSPGVLVVIVPTVADWERVQREGWYRIPLRRAPQRIGAEYLAFYHPGCFGDLRWSIRTYASIRAYGLVTRRELLPEEPGHPRADELYYRIELGPLQTLPHPVRSEKLRRVTFVHTDLETLFRATDVRELWHHVDRKASLWHALQLSEARMIHGAYAA